MNAEKNELGSGTRQRRVIVSETPPVAFGLGLCDMDTILTPAEQRQLDESAIVLEGLRGEAANNAAKLYF